MNNLCTYNIGLFGEYTDEEIELLNDILTQYKEKMKYIFHLEDIQYVNFKTLNTRELINKSIRLFSKNFYYCIYKFPSYNFDTLIDYNALYMHLLQECYKDRNPIIYIHTALNEDLRKRFLPEDFDGYEFRFCSKMKVDLDINCSNQLPSLESRVHDFFIRRTR